MTSHSFYGLVLALLLLIGGVEPNPGPQDQIICELCGSDWEDLQRKENSLLELERHLEEKQRDLLAKEKVIQERLELLHEREGLLTRREMMHLETEKAFFNVCVPVVQSATESPPPITEEALEEAVTEGRINDVRIILKKISVDVVLNNRNCSTPLLLACEKGHLPIVRYLVEEEEACVYATDYNCHFATHLAAIGGYCDIIEYLVTVVNMSGSEKTRFKFTPLHYAAEKGHLSVVRFLVECAKVDLYEENCKGKTALDLAISTGNHNIAKYLVTEANMNLPGWSVLKEMFFKAAELGRLGVVRFFVEDVKVPLREKNFDGMTALHIAASKGQVHIVKYLWEVSDKTPFGVDRYGWTALHHACHCSCYGTALYLVNSGAEDKEVKDNQGRKAKLLNSKFKYVL